jgi:hypothetical protein
LRAFIFESLNNIGTLGSKPILKPALSAVVLANNASFIESLAALFPQFSSVMETLECGEPIPAREAYRGDVGYVSITDVFVDSSASMLNLYRFLCLPCCSKHKSAEVYLQGLNGLLDRCVCSNRISGFIRKHARKMISISQVKHLPRVQIF